MRSSPDTGESVPNLGPPSKATRSGSLFRWRLCDCGEQDVAIFRAGVDDRDGLVGLQILDLRVALHQHRFAGAFLGRDGCHLARSRELEAYRLAELAVGAAGLNHQ